MTIKCESFDPSAPETAFERKYKEARPWTRLGYTYDWGSKADKYGLTEYIVVPGAEMDVRFTRNLKFIANWMKDRK